MNTNSSHVPLHRVPVYEVRLVKSRRSLRLAEPIIPEANSAARTMHTMLGLTDREHLAVLFLNGRHQVTGAHVVAIGGQHGIGTIEPRTVFRAAITACASALVLGHNHPSGVMPTRRLCGRGLWGAPRGHRSAMIAPHS